jgi:hypothetical protein
MAKTQQGKEDKEIINALAGLIKTSQLHSLNNIAVTNAIKKLSETLDFFLREEPVTLELVGEFFHLNGSRIRFSTDTIFNYNFLINEFKSRELGCITFRNPVREDNIKILLTALNTTDTSQPSFERLSEDLEKAENIDIMKLRQKKNGQKGIPQRCNINEKHFKSDSFRRKNQHKENQESYGSNSGSDCR